MRIAARSTAIDAYRVLFFHLGTFCRLAGGWMACLLGCILVRMVAWPQSIGLLLLLITLAGLAVFSAAFSVNWYRALLDEEPAPDLVPLTLGGRELHFLAYQSAIALVPGIPLLMLVMLLHADAWWAEALTIVHGGSLALMPTLRLLAGFAFSIPASIAATIILPRLMIVLPAVATDVSGPLLAPLWQHSRGNTAPILYGWLACVLPPLGLWAVLSFELTGALDGLAQPIVELIAYVCWFLALALSGGFLCQVYAQLTTGKASSPDAAALGRRVAAE
ncbi:MAG TPA: hypothetical protein VMA53_17780 [Stellaceae bacterium]|nr:hypothetical protein [Stellaceae bacterium]